MHQFTDAKSRSWTITIDVPTARRVRDLTKIELLTLLDGDASAYVALRTDAEKLCDLLCALCRPQLHAQDVSDEDFAAGIVGDAWQAAVDALTQELIFFSRPGIRQALQAALDATQAQERAAAETARRMAEELAAPEALEALQARVQEEISRRLTTHASRPSGPGNSSASCSASAG